MVPNIQYANITHPGAETGGVSETVDGQNYGDIQNNVLNHIETLFSGNTRLLGMHYQIRVHYFNRRSLCQIYGYVLLNPRSTSEDEEGRIERSARAHQTLTCDSRQNQSADHLKAGATEDHQKSRKGDRRGA
jgi:hypothetical protein